MHSPWTQTTEWWRPAEGGPGAGWQGGKEGKMGDICNSVNNKNNFLNSKRKNKKINLWPWLSNFYLHTSCSPPEPRILPRTKGDVSPCGARVPPFLSTPSHSMTSTCDWQTEEILEKWAIFLHGVFPQNCLFPDLKEKFPWQLNP